MNLDEYLTIGQFAAATGLSLGYVRSLIASTDQHPGGRVPTKCPVPGLQRPKLIHRSLVAEWAQPRATGRPRGPRKHKTKKHN